MRLSGRSPLERRTVNTAVAVLGLLLLLSWFLVIAWNGLGPKQRLGIRVGGGALHVWWNEQGAAMLTSHMWSPPFELEVLPKGMWFQRYWIPRWRNVTGYWGFTLPLWLPFGLTLLPAVPLWRAERKRRRLEGPKCGCGYGRRGLPAESPCPECGAAPPSSGA
jgi:hypothetical protein